MERAQDVLGCSVHAVPTSQCVQSPSGLQDSDANKGDCLLGSPLEAGFSADAVSASPTRVRAINTLAQGASERTAKIARVWEFSYSALTHGSR